MSSLPFSYLCFGCSEIVNHARLAAYIRNASMNGLWENLECCIELQDACYCPADGVPEQYVSPAADGVCWYDPSIPESPDFLGMFITSVTGLNDSTFSRQTTGNLGRGITLNRPQTGGRTFAIEAIMIATSCCGMDYGSEFIRRTLELGGCGNGSCIGGCGDLGNCGLSCMTGRTCCPSFEGDDSGLRQWVNVGLIDGLTEVSEGDTADCRCCWRKVTFTVQSETPESYSIEPVICIDKNADLENVAVKCFDWYSCDDPNETEPDCTDDPNCAPDACVLPSPPQRVNYCWCEPLGVSIDCCCPDELSNHRDETYRITIDAGVNPSDAGFIANGLRSARIKFYTADPKLPCPSDDDVSAGLWGEAQECALLEVPYLKPGSRIVIDGRLDKITVECDGQCFPGAGSVFGVNGADPFPLLASCAGIFICIEWDLQHTQFVDDAGAGAVPSHVKIERYKVYA